MSNDEGVLRVRVLGADPAHADREARELRDRLRGLAGIEARFAERKMPGPGRDGAKGALLTPEVVLLVSGGSLGLARVAIKGWVEVRKSRRVRLESGDGTVTEMTGLSRRELRELREQHQGERGESPEASG
ncbi:hypothetical protein I5Q34_32010 [Streptomyces sp. AV19]|uniref:effector-associated constant component EACC1 n=1 Tax=Streptomyces sp. AV19 TaxID=2793068 RepID=UPI0018FEB894|nr:hypothetical protein [Streptomyces sp. AV19]MBH1938832.1 hypothetical protein [Streptomyces sp. AV19]MDG4534765.1 hypothetical protein [Streptomyces sp. AV19]